MNGTNTTLNQQKTDPNDPGMTDNRWIKFGAGAFAGFAGLQFPRLISLITDLSSGGYKGTDWTEEGIYLGVVIGVAALMGIFMMLMEHKTPRLPRETFFTALALPSLIGGAFNVGEGTLKSNSRIEGELAKGNIEIIDEADEAEQSLQFFIEDEEEESGAVKAKKKPETEKPKKEEPADKKDEPAVESKKDKSSSLFPRSRNQMESLYSRPVDSREATRPLKQAAIQAALLQAITDQPVDNRLATIQMAVGQPLLRTVQLAWQPPLNANDSYTENRYGDLQPVGGDDNKEILKFLDEYEAGEYYVALHSANSKKQIFRVRRKMHRDYSDVNTVVASKVVKKKRLYLLLYSKQGLGKKYAIGLAIRISWKFGDYLAKNKLNGPDIYKLPVRRS